jgi:hypothetical protein
LRTLLRERVGSGGPLWLAGQVDHWDQGLPLLARGALGPSGDTLAKLRSVAAWVEVDRQITVRATAQAAGAAAVTEVEKLLAPAREKSPEALKVVRAGEWITVQYRTDLAGLRQALGR